MNKPLISVMMPCYNAEKTILRALYSLKWQSYDNWECVVVDDGSLDRTVELINQFPDSRLSFHKFDKNMGRGVARQYALENARGDYLCVLDSDDWWYPDKLSRQVEIMAKNEALTLVSSSIGIFDSSGELRGVRGGGSKGDVTLHQFEKLALPPVAWNPCMIRMKDAKDARFDKRFYLAQDTDFLVQVLLNKQYAVVNEILYAYGEYDTVTVSKVAGQLAFVREMSRKYVTTWPLRSRYMFAASHVKSVLYRGLFAVGARDAVLRYRSRRPNAAEMALYNVYYSRLVECLKSAIPRGDSTERWDTVC